jgi:hypothetical protein
MPTRTAILIAVLALVTGILVYLAVISQSARRAPTTQNLIPTEKPVEKTAQVFFNPQNVDLSSGSATPASSVDVMVDSGGQEIAGVQIELQYDPKALTAVRVTPDATVTSFFGTGATVLFNETKVDTGRISYAIAVSPGQNSKKGVGRLAMFSFQKAFGAPATTIVTFLDKTLVTVLGANQSALKSTAPLSIVLSQTPNVFAPSIIPSVPVTQQ